MKNSTESVTDQIMLADPNIAQPAKHQYKKGLAAVMEHIKHHPDAVSHVIQHVVSGQRGSFAPKHKKPHPKHPPKQQKATALEGGEQLVPAGGAPPDQVAPGWGGMISQALAASAALRAQAGGAVAAPLLPQLASALAPGGVMPQALAALSATRSFAPVARPGQPGAKLPRSARPAGGILDQFVPPDEHEQHYAGMGAQSRSSHAAAMPASGVHQAAAAPGGGAWHPSHAGHQPVPGYSQEQLEDVLSDFLDRQARLPPSGITGFDPRMSPAWPGFKMPG